MTRKISVDLGRLRESYLAVKADTEQGLAPGLSDTDARIQFGVRFGLASPSGEARLARIALMATLAGHRENAARHVETAQLITHVLDQVVTRYQATDALVEVDIQELLK